MKDKYLVDKNNLHPLVTCTMNHVDRTATIELSSVEETNRLLKLAHIRIFEKDCIIFANNNNFTGRLIRLGDTNYGGTNNLVNFVQATSASNAAHAQAAALIAM
jgi:hypothetical protein